MPSTRRILFGTAMLIPGMERLPLIKRMLDDRAKGTGGSVSPRYCYSVWMRHLIAAGNSGLNTNPATVAELGPGDSLGVGIAALLTGAQRYYALDVVEHASVGHNLTVLEGVVDLLRARATIPGPDEFPRVVPNLPNYEFPHHILTAERLDAALTPERIERIRASLRNTTSEESLITYKAPWFGATHIEKDSTDMLFSQAVLEHVDALAETYATMHKWLAPNGFLSHTVDFKCHGSAKEWNGHWRYSDLAWRVIRAKAVWSINRQLWSTHEQYLAQTGFRIVHKNVYSRPSTLTARQLATRFKNARPDDLTTAEVFYHAVKATS